MKFKTSTLFAAMLLMVASSADAVAHNHEKCRQEVISRGRGYYKEIFMDGGISLTSRTSLPAAQFLGVKMEYFASAKEPTKNDTLRQHRIFCGSENDTNGWLFYPDGAPRFRMIYVNGGKAAPHALSFGNNGADGFNALNNFVKAGGSYVGTCAGAYVASKGGYTMKSNSVRNVGTYWNLWPGFTHTTRLRKSFTKMNLDRKSPLLRYFDFGGDRTVDSVRHNGGCYAYDGGANGLPAKTEALARYGFKDTDKVQIDGKLAVWGYKENDDYGRVILCGSHPESIGQGERVEFMSAMVLYAMDGNPTPKTKAHLEEGVVREMNKKTEDNDPAFTRIGDRQYHHFEIEIPRKCKRAVVSIEGYEEMRYFDLSLLAKQGELAFHDNTTIKSVARGCKKKLYINNPKPGKWYVSVFCETTVVAYTGKYGTYYRGKTEVLNGVPYKISVKYE